jgi:hypothetical protein
MRKYIEIYKSFRDENKDLHVITFRSGDRIQQAIGIDEERALALAERIHRDNNWAALRRVS